MPLHLTGARVFLRALETRDLDSLISTYRDFDLQLTTDGDAPPLSDAQVRAFWTEIIEHPGDDLRYFAVEPLPGSPGAGGMVGGCSLQHIDLRNRHAELAIFMVAQDWRGQGYGTEAVRLLLRYGFEVVRLDKVYLGVYDFNESGMRSYERVGFRYEGRLRQMLHYDGRYWDEWRMGILRGEWERYMQPPADGLRPYHPDDQDAALALIQRLRSLPDEASARAMLRRWWRLLDHEVWSYQVDNRLVGVVSIEPVSGKIIDMIVEQTYQTALKKAIRHIAHTRPSSA
jgi:RimJ/RimL family protein N-acetyltransferase